MTDNKIFLSFLRIELPCFNAFAQFSQRTFLLTTFRSETKRMMKYHKKAVNGTLNAIVLSYLRMSFAKPVGSL